ncbi:MAG: Fe-S-containing protein [Syntrophomonadaceae bacterium]|nr:Fe-S-containing protein [Syntrophomonadaceae bacterium]
MNTKGKFQKIAFYGAVALAIMVIAFYALNPKQTTQPNLSVNQPPAASSSAENQASSDTPTDSTPADNSQKSPVVDDKSAASTSVNESKASPTNVAAAIKIAKNEVTAQAKFYPYVLDGTKMEIIAVKATDGTIRTALNTCQVCYDSGRGYYVQEGNYLVCQNCGNKFHIDQIEKIKGGCNPVPIMEDSKTDMGSYIALSQDFIATQKQYFVNWKNS